MYTEMQRVSLILQRFKMSFFLFSLQFHTALKYSDRGACLRETEGVEAKLLGEKAIVSCPLRFYICI